MWGSAFVALCICAAAATDDDDDDVDDCFDAELVHNFLDFNVQIFQVTVVVAESAVFH